MHALKEFSSLVSWLYSNTHMWKAKIKYETRGHKKFEISCFKNASPPSQATLLMISNAQHWPSDARYDDSTQSFHISHAHIYSCLHNFQSETQCECEIKFNYCSNRKLDKLNLSRTQNYISGLCARRLRSG